MTPSTVIGSVFLALLLALGVQSCRVQGKNTALAEAAAMLADTKRKHADTLRHIADLTAITARAVHAREGEIRGLLDSSNKAREEGISHAVEEQQRIVAGVLDGSLGMREQWAGCTAASATAAVSGDAIASARADADAQLRAESAGRIVRAGEDADLQIRGLQDYARACAVLTAPLP